ncbi:MAG: pentapeptide repeat-containing protein [Acidimicrobiales bacterium]
MVALASGCSGSGDDDAATTVTSAGELSEDVTGVEGVAAGEEPTGDGSSRITVEEAVPSTTTPRPVMTPPPSPTKDYSDAVFQTASSPGDDYSSGDFSDALIFDSDFTGADFSGSTFKDAVIQRSTMDNANFTDANLADALISKSTSFDGAIWKNTVCPDESNSDDNGGTCEGHL